MFKDPPCCLESAVLSLELSVTEVSRRYLAVFQWFPVEASTEPTSAPLSACHAARGEDLKAGVGDDDG